jgi:hypothetical protein
LRVYHLLIGVILLALSPFILKTVFKDANSNKNVQPQPTPSVTASPASAVTTQLVAKESSNIWKNALTTTTAPTGWNVAPCNGNAPFLCISSNGKNLGSVEMASYPISKQPKLQKMLSDAGITTGANIDYQNPNYQSKIREALNAWIRDEYEAISKDRQNTYANKVNFLAYPPQKISIGRLQGVRYGFTGMKREGGVIEQHLKYVTSDGNSIYVINAAYDSTSASGKFDKYENLAVFEPYLSEIASNLKLPQ